MLLRIRMKIKSRFLKFKRIKLNRQIDKTQTIPQNIQMLKIKLNKLTYNQQIKLKQPNLKL